ncbi:MAG TPA: LacI family DNA-binding transcriptional regulator [Magnetospirillaceae bacterium]|nr:LacI family DNA-binding transcriptional regulator [Magnetospirillaceae bacterium]
MTGKVTVYSIARELGLSPSTVSRVLNNSTLISESTRELILSAAERLNYSRRPIRRPAGRAIPTARLFLPPTKYSYIHLFYDVAELIDGIQAGFGETRVNIITSVNDGDLSLFDIKKLAGIDGCIFAFTVPSPSLELLLGERAIPFVLLNREVSENNYVAVDGAAGMGRLVRALWERRGPDLRPCYIGFSPLPGVSGPRGSGVLSACGELGVPMSESDIYDIETIPQLAGPAFSDILARGYNSLMCFNDLIAVTVYQAALHRGLEVPGDFSLTGFDNSPVLDLLDQRIDTLEFSVHMLGKEAGQWLRRRVIDRSEEPVQKRLEGAYVPGETI